MMSMPIIKVVRMPEFMENKSCPYCKGDAFVVVNDDEKDYQVWKCAHCSKSLLRECVKKKGFFSRLFRGR